MDLYGWLKNQWDRALSITAALAGVAFLILGWWGVSGADLTTKQIPYLVSGAVAGMFALGIAATLWLSADLRDEWRELHEIFVWMQSGAERDSMRRDSVPER